MSKGKGGGKARDRTVYKSGDDRINKRNDADRVSSKHNTQKEALAAANRMLKTKAAAS